MLQRDPRVVCGKMSLDMMCSCCSPPVMTATLLVEMAPQSVDTSSRCPRILSGIQSSGRLHLGNYYGAIRQFVELQNEGEALYFIADLHASHGAGRARAARAHPETALAFLALGLDPKRPSSSARATCPRSPSCTGSSARWCRMSNLERAHSYKDKSPRHARRLRPLRVPGADGGGHPLYGSDVVPVGKDQVQHVEFARDWATKFNVTYVPGYDPQDPRARRGPRARHPQAPEARVQEDTAVVPGVDGQKMSKSYGNTIEMFGDEKEVKKADHGHQDGLHAGGGAQAHRERPLPAAQADGPARRVRGDRQQLEGGRQGLRRLQETLLEYFHATFDPARQRREELRRDPAEVERILEEGAQRARAIAAPIMDQVRRATGIR